MTSQSCPNRLSILRKQHGMSQKQIAALVGQDRTMISMYERGRTLPSLSVAGRLQLLFDLNIAEIFPGLFRKLEQELAAKRQSLGRRVAEGVQAQ
jgi:transcriptional regulator with XRE-family HTH domain